MNQCTDSLKVVLLNGGNGACREQYFQNKYPGGTCRYYAEMCGLEFKGRFYIANHRKLQKTGFIRLRHPLRADGILTSWTTYYLILSEKEDKSAEHYNAL